MHCWFTCFGLWLLFTVVQCDDDWDPFIAISKVVLSVNPSRMYELTDDVQLQIYVGQTMLFTSKHSEYDDHYSNIYFPDLDEVRIPSCLHSNHEAMTLQFDVSQNGIDGLLQPLSFARLTVSKIYPAFHSPLGIRLYDVSSDYMDTWGWIIISAHNHCFESVDPVHPQTTVTTREPVIDLPRSPSSGTVSPQDITTVSPQDITTVLPHDIIVSASQDTTTSLQDITFASSHDTTVSPQHITTVSENTNLATQHIESTSNTVQIVAETSYDDVKQLLTEQTIIDDDNAMQTTPLKHQTVPIQTTDDTYAQDTVTTATGTNEEDNAQTTFLEPTHLKHETVSTQTTDDTYVVQDTTTTGRGMNEDDNVQTTYLEPIQTNPTEHVRIQTTHSKRETVPTQTTEGTYVQDTTTDRSMDDADHIQTTFVELNPTEHAFIDTTESLHIALETADIVTQSSNTYVIDIGKELDDLKDKLVDDGDEQTSTEIVHNVTNVISISKHLVHENISNQTIDELVDICSPFVDIPETFWAVDYLTESHPSTLDCVFIQQYKEGMNTSNNDTNHTTIPDEISLFVVDGSTNLSTDVIPNTDIVDTDNNCIPIQVTLNWNQNGEYDNVSYVPQCNYKAPYSMQHSEHNYECFVMDYDDSKVQCGCTQFGTYSVEATQHIPTGYYVNHAVNTWVIGFWVFLILSFCVFTTKWNEFDDEPLIAKEVYMPQRRIWLLTKEGETHRILKYEKHSKRMKLWMHLMKNDGLILPFFRRNKGSNYFPMQRMLNLLWLVLAMTLSTCYIINNRNDSLCLFDDNPLDWHCAGALFVLFLFIVIGLLLYTVHKHCFERTRPQKLHSDLSKIAFREFNRLFGTVSDYKYEDMEQECDRSKGNCGIIGGMLHDVTKGKMTDVEDYDAYVLEMAKHETNREEDRCMMDEDMSSVTEEYMKSSDQSCDEELGYNANESKQCFYDEWTETDDDSPNNNKSQKPSFFRIVSDGLSTLISPHKPKLERSWSAGNSFGYLKNIFFDVKDKNSGNFQQEEESHDVEYTVDATYSIGDDSSTDSSDEDLQIHPTVCSMDAPMMNNDRDSDSNDNMNGDLLLNSGNDLMTDGGEVVMRNTSSEIQYELAERKEAMFNHYYIDHTTKYVLMWYLFVTMIIFSVLLVIESMQFNDATFHGTSPTRTEVAARQAQSVLPETCTFNFSLLLNREKERDERQWALIADQMNTGYVYGDTQKWIGLSVLSLVLCWLTYWFLLFLKAHLLINRFDFFAEFGYDPLFCDPCISKRYYYPNSPCLTSMFDQDSVYYVDGGGVKVKTPKPTKNADLMLRQSMDDENTDDTMQSGAEPMHHDVEEELEDQLESLSDNGPLAAMEEEKYDGVRSSVDADAELRLSPVREINDKTNGNHYLDATLVMFDEDGQLLNPKQPYIVLNNESISNHDDIENAHESNT
eukprot:24497_1